MREWDWEANTLDPTQIAPHSGYSAHWICFKKKHKWTTQISVRTSNHRGCPRCRESHGEKKLFEVAKKLKLDVIKRSIKGINLTTGQITTMFFDMFILILLAAVEFDGIQHFVPWIFPSTLEDTIKRDRSKNIACAQQGIHLLRISYLEFDQIELWVQRFVDAIKTFRPSTFVTSTGQVIQQKTVVMVSNPELYNQQKALFDALTERKEEREEGKEEKQ